MIIILIIQNDSWSVCTKSMQAGTIKCGSKLPGLNVMHCTQHSSKPHLITVIHSCNQHLETRRTERNINSINVFQVHDRVGKEVAEDTLQCVPKVLLGAHTYMAIVRVSKGSVAVVQFPWERPRL